MVRNLDLDQWRRQSSEMSNPYTTRESARRVVLLNALRECRLFGDMASPDLEVIAGTCETRSYEKGEYIFREQERAVGFFIVQSGAVKVHRLSAEGREQVIAIFRPYDSFAEVVLTTFETYPAHAVALESTQVVVVRKNDFRELVMRKPELALRMLTSMSFHLNHILQVMEDQKFKRIESRLAHHLLRNSPGVGSAEATPFSVQLDTSKKVLAGRLGVSSETLSRAFAKFRKEGLIEVDRNVITILNPTGLRVWVDAVE